MPVLVDVFPSDLDSLRFICNEILVNSPTSFLSYNVFVLLQSALSFPWYNKSSYVFTKQVKEGESKPCLYFPLCVSRGFLLLWICLHRTTELLTPGKTFGSDNWSLLHKARIISKLYQTAQCFRSMVFWKIPKKEVEGYSTTSHGSLFSP